MQEKERFHYLNLEKGYEGEVTFDLLIENLQPEMFIINDLLLEISGSYFQIDTVIIRQGNVLLIDIKNYQGDCYLESDNMYSVATSREYKNPVNQLKRSTVLFRQLLQNLNQNFLVESSLLFINSEFTLYQAPMDQPIILPTQINGFIRDLNNTSSTLNDSHKNLAQKLLSLHKTKNPFTNIPEYAYDKLQKGMYCKKCGSFIFVYRKPHFICNQCGEHEKLESAIMRNVREYELLFPNDKITTQKIYDWCRVDLNKRTFARVLNKNYKPYGHTRGTYYKVE
ncbi:nuclease-related domain-containing protein [Aquibacillus salsiterrae]|uniref:nuclease-related domain-containing protein n=1 Tax=Aquibacillus salsiterrae TaxID=2950439 RepID=UPI002FEDFF9B